jgi:hypothetical protein
MNTKSFLIILLIIVLVASAYFVYVKTRDDVEDIVQYSVEDQKRILLYNEARLDFSIIDTRYDIPISQLPAELRFLILENAHNIQSYELMHNMNSVGHQVDFDMDGLLLPIYEEYGLLLHNNPEWNFVSGARMEHFALREMENSRYNARIYQSQVDDNTVRVSIEIVLK